jgi:hypothetical protein
VRCPPPRSSRTATAPSRSAGPSPVVQLPPLPNRFPGTSPSSPILQRTPTPHALGAPQGSLRPAKTLAAPPAPALTLVLGLLFEHEEICAFLITLSSRVLDFFTGSQAKWRSRRNHR